MPNCCSGTCNCLVTAGPGATVGGAGTTGSPYVVSLGSNMTGQLPIGRYIQHQPDTNNNVALTKGTEFSWPIWIPGSGTLDRIAFQVQALTTDATNVIRFGIRADNVGVPGTVITETSISVTAASGGTVGWKELTVSVACGARYWVSLCAQGTGVALASIQTSNAPSSWFEGQVNSRAAIDWAAGHNPRCSTVANTSGALSSAGPPTGPNQNQLSGAVPVLVVRRGT